MWNNNEIKCQWPILCVQWSWSPDLLSLFMQTAEAPSKIFLINCLCAIQQPLLGHEVASEYVKKIGRMMESHMMNGLVEKGVDGILKRSGLLSKTTHFCVSLDDDEAGKTVNGSE